MVATTANFYTSADHYLYLCLKGEYQVLFQISHLFTKQSHFTIECQCLTPHLPKHTHLVQVTGKISSASSVTASYQLRISGQALYFQYN